jgi:hypothetical protein
MRVVDLNRQFQFRPSQEFRLTVVKRAQDHPVTIALPFCGVDRHATLLIIEDRIFMGMQSGELKKIFPKSRAQGSNTTPLNRMTQTRPMKDSAKTKCQTL